LTKLQWTWLDWLIFTFRCSWYGTGLMYYYVYQERLGELSFLEFALFVTVGFIIPQFFWRPGYVQPKHYAIAELLVSGGFSIYINNILGIQLSTSIILLPILMIGYLLTRKTAIWTIPLFVVLLPANRYWTMDSQFTFFLQYIDILLFFGIGVGFNIISKSQKRYKQLLEENMKQFELIQQQNKALEQYAAEVEKLALFEERNRMARDLHDSIGHHFTSVTVGLDAISYMVESHPKLAVEKIHHLAEIARTGLAEVRRTIHQIAPPDDDLNLTVQLERLLTEFGVTTGTKVDYTVIGTEPVLAPHLKLTLVRCLQESITNAKRHGDAEAIQATLHFFDEMVKLEIYNNGKRMDTRKLGFGLSSMKNRLEELNGELIIKNEIEGVTVICTLPIRRYSYEKNSVAASR
jgi:glucose-6-phosphate-specific signal transduction histidine kinase